jgi:hypothetical protein
MKRIALLALLVASPLTAQNTMSFFITSKGPGDGAKLGGLAGADAHCKTLADASGVAGIANKTWRAYLSAKAADGQPAVNAKDRIGSGPWYNRKGVMVARNVADRHSDNNKLGKENSLTEKGMEVPGRGNAPNHHDILTGSLMNGTLSPDTTDTTCNNWTSNAAGAAYVGHHDRLGGGTNPTSWNSAHLSRGCSQQNLVGTGGNGYFYCFAIN